MRAQFFGQECNQINEKDRLPIAKAKLEDKDTPQVITCPHEFVTMKAGAVYDEDGDLGWKQAEDAGIKVYELSDDEKAEWEKALQPVYSKWIDEMEAKGLPGKEIYDEAVRLKNQ